MTVHGRIGVNNLDAPTRLCERSEKKLKDGGLVGSSHNLLTRNV